MNKWEFDKKYLQDIINRAEILMKKKKLPKNKKIEITDDIEMLLSFLEDDYKIYDDTEPLEETGLTFKQLKEKSLRKMETDYKQLGKKFVNWIIALFEEDIFYPCDEFEQTSLSIDEQAEFTIKNYERNSRALRKMAKNFIYKKPTTIQCVDSPDSYCNFCGITQEPFLVINPNESCFIFNHELAHGLEYLIGFNRTPYYTELGAIFSELLFLDTFSYKNGSLKTGDFELRINEAYESLEDIVDYFMILKALSKKDFKVTDEEFKDILINEGNVRDDKINEYLYYDVIVSDGILNAMNYLFSFLKAIELRKKVIESKSDALDVVAEYLIPKFRFNPQTENFDMYANYIEEMHKRVRK